jgi:hypothetical protein
MPAADMFQQIAKGQPGPFSDYLRPYQPRPIDAPMPESSGFENTPQAIAEIGLGFLKGVRQRRLAEAAEKDRNTEESLERFRNYVNELLSSPDLTQQGKEEILRKGSEILDRHSRYELRNAPKEGVAGFFRNLFLNLSGGPIKEREPVNWDEATGQLKQLADQHSQQKNFESAVAEAQQKLTALQSSNPNLSAEQVQREMLPVYFKIIQNAPNYAGVFADRFFGGRVEPFPSVSSPTWQMQELMRTSPRASVPNTQPPPTQLNYTPIAGFTPSVRPADMTQTASTGQPGSSTSEQGIEYLPGYGPERFARLSALGSMQSSPVQVGRPTLVTTGKRRVMAVEVMGSPDPNDNGYWEVQTGKKIQGPVVAVSIASNPGIHVDSEGRPMYFDANIGRMVYAEGPDNNPVRLMRSPVRVTGPDGVERWVYPSESNIENQPTGSVARDYLSMQRERRKRLSDLDKWLDSQNLETNRIYNKWVNDIRSKNIDIVLQGLASLGVHVDPATARQAMTNPQPLIDIIEAQRQQALQENKAAWARERQSIDENFPSSPPPSGGRVSGSPKSGSSGAGGAGGSRSPSVPVPSQQLFDSLLRK